MVEVKPKSFQEWATDVVTKLAEALSSFWKSIKAYFIKPIRCHMVKRKKGPARRTRGVRIAMHSNKSNAYITKVIGRKLPNRKALHS